MKGKISITGIAVFTTSILLGCFNDVSLGGSTQQGKLSSTSLFSPYGSSYSGPWVVECFIWDTTIPLDTTKDQIYIRQNETKAWFVPSHKWFQDSQSKGVIIYGDGYEGFEYKLTLHSG